MSYTREYVKEIQGTIENLPLNVVDETIKVLHDARMNKRQIFIMGNGGSASTASHFVCDLSKNTRKEDWPHFRVIGLTDNIALLSAYANDEGYENVFSRQLANLAQPGDIVIAISASGQSPNVIRAVDLAKHLRAYTIGFTGFDGGGLGRMVDLNVHIPSENIEQVEDVHLILEHMITKALRESIRTRPAPLNESVFSQQIEATNFLSSAPVTSGIPSGTMDASGSRKNRYVFDLVQEIMKHLNGMADVHDLLDRLLSLSLESVGAASGSIVILNDQGEAMEGALWYGGKSEIYPAPKFLDIVQKGLAGWVVRNREVALVENTRKDPRWLSRAWEINEESGRSAISVPLTDKTQVVGVVTLVNSREKPFTQEDMAVLTAIAVTISVNKVRTLSGKKD
jgi:D-sedoheptulose 7-phosphate isomerase